MNGIMAVAITARELRAIMQSKSSTRFETASATLSTGPGLWVQGSRELARVNHRQPR
jgi:hypothetical protein